MLLKGSKSDYRAAIKVVGTLPGVYLKGDNLNDEILSSIKYT